MKIEKMWETCMQYMQQEKLLHVHKSTETSIESSIETTENIHSDLIHSRAWLKPCIDLNLEKIIQQNGSQRVYWIKQI